MHFIASKLLSFINQQLSPEQTIVVAYSGGVDSQVLLQVLAELKAESHLQNRLIAFHVNHGLSPNAKAWLEFTAKQASLLSVEFMSTTLALKKVAGQSLEATARDARYNAFLAQCPENAVIFTGHHLNDQIETFFLALKRGSGLSGLSAMDDIRPLSSSQNSAISCSISLARPLLSISREDIVSYALSHHLNWIEDESNFDCQFDRNFIRHEVVSQLKARWPGSEKAIARSIAHCSDAQELLDELAEQDLENLILASGKLSITKLAAFFTQHKLSRCHNVIRYYLNGVGCLMPSMAQLSQFEQLLTAPEDKTPEVKLGDKVARRFQNELYITHDYSDISQWQAEFTIGDLPLTLALPDGNGVLEIALATEDEYNKESTLDSSICCELMLATEGNDKFSVRFKHDNPKVKVLNRDMRRTVKKLLQESKLAPWQRRRVPFIYHNHSLMAALGTFVVEDFTDKAPFDTQQPLTKLMINWTPQ